MAHHQTKSSILQVVFDRFSEFNDNHESFTNQINNAGALSRQVMTNGSLPAFNERADNFGDPLANACVSLTFKFELRNLREEARFDGVVIPA